MASLETLLFLGDFTASVVTLHVTETLRRRRNSVSWRGRRFAVSQALRGPEQWLPSSTYKQKHIRCSANSCIRYDIIDSFEVEASGIPPQPPRAPLLLLPAE